MPYADHSQLQAMVPTASGDGLDWPALMALLPSLALLGETPQDPIYHAEGDVLVHTRMVCEALLSLPRYQLADADRRFVLFYAALLHDIAKPSCTTIHEGRVSSPGHSRRGAIDARILLWRAGVPFRLREAICGIIANHQVPFFAIRGGRSAGSAEFTVQRLSWELDSVADLAAVAEADNRGRISEGSRETQENIELFRLMADELDCLEGPASFADAHTRLAYCRSSGGISVDYPFFQNPGSQVTVLSGLPASGKDTWVREHAGSLPVISFDDALAELGLRHGGNVGAAIHLAIDRAKVLLRDGAPFVWNATHLSMSMRKKTMDLLYAYDASVRVVYLESPEREILRRNTKRNTTLTNAGIEKMLFRWEPPLATEAHEVRHCIDSGRSMPKVAMSPG